MQTTVVSNNHGRLLFYLTNVSSTNLSFLLYHKPPLPLLWKRRGHSAGIVYRHLSFNFI